MSDQDKSRLTFFRDNILRMRGYQAGEQPQGDKIIKLNTITINSTCNELQLDTLKEYIQTYYDKIFNKN